MPNLKLILASASPSRLSLLKDIDIFPDQVLSTDIDETPKKGEIPRRYCFRVAEEKFVAAQKIISKERAILITADTISACGRRMLNKPENDAQVKSHLKLLSGRRHVVYTTIFCGIIENNISEKVLNRTVKTTVTFKRMTEEEIDYVVASGQGIGKCGGCQIAKLGGRFVKFVSGSFSNIIGLPQHDIYQMLTSLGHNLNNS
jgi:septum formation protein